MHFESKHAQLLVIKEAFCSLFSEITRPRLALMLRRVCAGSAAASTLQMYDGLARRLAHQAGHCALISSSCGQPQPPPLPRLTVPCRTERYIQRAAWPTSGACARKVSSVGVWGLSVTRASVRAY